MSNRGPQFVAEFTKELYRLLGLKLAATTTYHPQGDRQMERVNQELEQYLWLFIHQRQNDWDNLLPLAEFQYNNHVHTVTQNIPFLLGTGQLPHMGFEPNQPPSSVESVNEFKEWMENALKEAKVALVKSKDNMVKYYNRRQTPAPDYQPRDKVYLDASDIALPETLSPEIRPLPRSPQSQKQCILPSTSPSMSRLHPVFNVVKLSPAPEDPIPG